MKCIKCETPIPEKRLEILPETKTCVNCSDTHAWYLRNIVSGKCEYMETEIIKDPKAAEVLRKMDLNVGWQSNIKKE